MSIKALRKVVNWDGRALPSAVVKEIHDCLQVHDAVRTSAVESVLWERDLFCTTPGIRLGPLDDFFFDEVLHAMNKP